MSPSRRQVLRQLGVTSLLVLLGGPLLGRALQPRAPRRRRPDDLAPIPWIGHC